METASRGYWYCRVPIVALEDPAMSAPARQVYVALCRYADASTGTCWPSHATLGRLSGIRSRVTVTKGLKELQHLGYISITTRKERGQTNIYTVRHLVDPQRRRGKNYDGEAQVID